MIDPTTLQTANFTSPPQVNPSLPPARVERPSRTANVHPFSQICHWAGKTNLSHLICLPHRTKNHFAVALGPNSHPRQFPPRPNSLGPNLMGQIFFLSFIRWPGLLAWLLPFGLPAVNFTPSAPLCHLLVGWNPLCHFQNDLPRPPSENWHPTRVRVKSCPTQRKLLKLAPHPRLRAQHSNIGLPPDLWLSCLSTKFGHYSPTGDGEINRPTSFANPLNQELAAVAQK